MPDLTGARDLIDLAKDRDAAAQANQGPRIRLLVCTDEHTIEELPDFKGPTEYDHLLNLAIEERHTDHISGTPHRGHLIDVPVKYWADTYARNEIIKQIWEGSGGISELDPDFYATKSEFGEEALRCFARHLRPKGQCPDWKIDSKKLVPKTAALRKEVGLPDPKYAQNLPYLCDFCPIRAYNQQREFEAKGLYK